MSSTLERDERRLRLWPGLAAASVVILGWYVAPWLTPWGETGQIAGAVAAFVIILWWLLFSRAPWLERVASLVLMPAAVLAVRPLLDVSITGGAQGMLGYIVALPAVASALVVWAGTTRQLRTGVRWTLLPVVLLAGCSTVALLRTDGIGGGALFQLQWRWTPTAEEQLLSRADANSLPPVAPGAPTGTVALGVPTGTVAPGVPTGRGGLQPSGPFVEEALASPAPQPAAASTTEPAVESAAAPAGAAVPASAPVTPAPPRVAAWTGFRGPERNGVVRGMRIETDWSASPPVELWRRRIGPGWSSFAVDGDLLYTQEQRGGDEIVACYRVSTGEPVWAHRDPVRFYESNGGAGPRGTPTVSQGLVFALGATGMLNALDGRTGAVVWSRNATSDTKVEVPIWGIAGSPLVVGDVVVIATSGTLAGYDVATGAPRWIGPRHEGSYSSPHLVTIDGVPQILLLSPPGVVSVSPADGTLLWEHAWDGGAIVQPAVMTDGVLISGLTPTGGLGIRRLAVGRGGAGWRAQERWTSNGLKPYFNDYVVHNGHAFGFDGSILSSIDLADGTRRWKGGRYGSGQLILLADQDLLLVLAEDGGLALVSATPDRFTEIARAPALEGKTWNHPALAGDVLLVRNGEEMAAFRLAR